MAHWETIPGWFDWLSGLQELIRDYPGGTIVEVGAFLGRSGCCLGELMQRSGKPWKAVLVDTCRGSGVENGTDNHGDAVRRGQGTFAGELHRNVIQGGLTDTVSILIADSVTAASFFPDRSLTAVILDAAHDYESVKRDILAWKGKVKPGGTLCGDDFIPAIWPGVVQAVTELLPGYRLWSHDGWTITLPDEN